MFRRMLLAGLMVAALGVAGGVAAPRSAEAYGLYGGGYRSASFYRGAYGGFSRRGAFSRSSFNRSSLGHGGYKPYAYKSYYGSRGFSRGYYRY